ncbi:disease resistance protein RGA2 isoform X1 [Aegilops tauschii subsp. strangulata]|uniref:Disease resistance protein RGA2 n=1 Tax=Aegilops tauschii TaxID=37682 RepID=R7W2L0_AEGTA|nr:disease resistance protein RGA2 isoform X1 [Aegilops tauschii subsp. strangulata]XP_020165837.1 disease resistance protein RGA2 isoform X1 [Aegilops tauschii subsp. strangulata]
MATAAAFAGKAVAIPAISLVGKAFSYLDKYHRSEGMEELKKRLELAMPNIEAVFDVVNPDHVREESPALDKCLWQLRAAVEDAENVVDELEYYELEEKAEERKVIDWGSSLTKMKHKVVRSVKKVSSLDKTLKNFSQRDTLKRLRKAVEGLDRSAAGIANFLTIADRLKKSASASQQQVDADRETSSELSVSKFVGREREKEKIIEWITKTSVESADGVTRINSVPIISVVGHGGMGKTTLAQSICKEDAVRNHFKVIWVTVSTNFDATTVTSKMLESVTGVKPGPDHLGPLQKNLKEELKSMKFLLVLDDVWEDKKESEWAKLFAPLRSLNSGSKILLTTRMQSVVDTATSSMGVEGGHCLTLQGLEEDENIKLLNHHVFFGLDPQDCEHFKSAGEQIARKLGGCPLVTKVVAGHLRGNMMIGYWNRFLHEELKQFSGTEEGIMRVLRLSYYRLPTELQICFRYCCIFPRDYEFEKKELIQMWMGSGLISQRASDSQTFEDIGAQILVQLNKSSFFELKSRPNITNGRKEEYYVMHDLMHDLATDVSSGECARVAHASFFEDDNRTIRHMCIANIHSFSIEEVKKISNYKYLRTIVIDHSDAEVKKDVVCELERVIESLEFLRLLRSRQKHYDCGFHLTEKCGKLIHLRYLSLHQISPEGICGVTRLYHLMLFYCKTVGNKEGKEMSQIRYLGNLDGLRYVSYGFNKNSHGEFDPVEFSVGRLTHLQELNNYLVKESIVSKLSEVKSLRTLRRLQVCGLEKVKNPEEAKDAKLNEIISLNSLSLSWFGEQNNKDALVLEHLEPHCNVMELEIAGYTGVKLPFWIEDLTIKNLVSLELRDCLSWEGLPSLGKLVWLRHIKFQRLLKLQQIGHFSSNTSMEFFLPPRLETLEVHDCPMLSELPVLPPSLVLLRISKVGLTKLPMIDGGSSETKPSQLVSIVVERCALLTSLEGSLLEQEMYMGALQYFKIENCRNLESGSIAFHGMNRLATLCIADCTKFSTIGTIKGELTYLNHLLIIECSGLVSLPSADVFMSFKSLRHMVIYRCENLLCLGGLGSLPSLQYLQIECCSQLVEVGSSLTPHASSSGEEDHLVQIHKLQVDLPSMLLVEPLKRLHRTIELVITHGPQMESLPEQWLIQNRQFLRCIRISEAKSLKSLPLSIRELSSLEELCIMQCHSELFNEIRENNNFESYMAHTRRVAIVPYSHVRGGGWFSIMGKECDIRTYERLRFEDIDLLTSWGNQPNDDEGDETPSSSFPSSEPWWRKYQCCWKNAS